MIVVSAASAQITTGIIRGMVVDSESGESLAGVNVSIKGTVLGSATNQTGEYVLERIPPGQYELVFSMVGYQRHSVQNVRVVPGVETTVSVQLVETIIQYEQIVVTASRREQRIEEVPVSIATVTSEEIVQRSNVTLDEALRYVPGVNMIQDQINIRGSSGYSRGVGSRVLLLVDGLPYLTGDTGEINWEVIPVYQIERIEVVKGAGSALYGSSALGGVINVLTKDIPEGQHASVRLYSGYYDKPRHSQWVWSSKPRFNSGVILNYSGRMSDFGYLISVGRTVDESYRQNDTFHRWNFFTKLQYTLSSTQTISVTGNLLNRTHGNFFWWRSLGEALLPDPPQLNGSVYSNRGNVSVAYNNFLANDLLLKVKGIYYGNFWRDDTAGHVRNVSTSHVGYGEVQLTYEITPGNVLTGGIAFNRDQVASNLFGNHPGVGFAAFAQDEMTLMGSLKATAGLRYDYQKVSVLDAAGQLSPKIGLLYDLSPATTVRASAGYGFRYPSIGELFISSSTNVTAIAVVPNINLKPERSVTLEVGIKHTFADFLLADGAVFHSEFTDLIEPYVNPTDLVIEFDNLTRATIQGAELDLQFNLFRRAVSGQIAYTYIWARERDSLGVEHPLKFRPRHLVHTSIGYSLGGFLAAAEYRYVSDIEKIDENLAELVIEDGEARVPIHVVDIRLSQNVDMFMVPIRIGFNVKNVFNYHYVELMGNMAPVRTFMISIEGGF